LDEFNVLKRSAADIDHCEEDHAEYRGDERKLHG